MKHLFTRGFTALFAYALLALTVACGSAPQAPAKSAATPVSKVTREQAMDMARNALTAYNSGDYAGFSRDWDDSMKKGINAAAFKQWRDGQMERSGRFETITGVEVKNGQMSGYVRWEFSTKFEKAQGKLVLVFPQNGDKVTGATVE